MIKIKSTRFAGLSMVKALESGSNNFTFESEDYGFVYDEAIDTENHGMINDPVDDSEDYFDNGGFSNDGEPVDPPVEPATPATYNRPAGGQDELGAWGVSADQNVTFTWTLTSSTGSGATLAVYDFVPGNGPGASASSPHVGAGIYFEIEGVGPTDFQQKEFFLTINALDDAGITTTWTLRLWFVRLG